MDTKGIEWETIRAFMEEKLHCLMNHENDVHQIKPNHPAKESAFVGFSIENSDCVVDRGRSFVIIFTNVFKQIIHSVLPIAVQKFTENFGTGNAKDVIEGIYKACPEGKLENFENFLKQENFAFIFEIKGNEILGKVLRLDLFRKTEERKDKKGYDFTGGALHAFKHFNYLGKPLSTLRENFDLEHPSSLVRHIIDAFFFYPFKEGKKENSFVSEAKLENGKSLEIIFFLEEKCNIYFLDTAHRV